jgi:hypothetical protein
MTSAGELQGNFASRGAAEQARTMSRVSKRLVDLENLLSDNIDNLTS